MREIKFRFRWKNTEDAPLSGVMPGEIGVFTATLQDILSGSLIDLFSNYPIISTDEFTGLKDKKGVDIYEKDIVSLKSGFRGREHTGIIEYGNGRFSLSGLYMTHFDNPGDFTEELKSCEIIGNIHDNPELLERR